MSPHGLTETDLAYMAGYLDADGCVGFYSGSPRVNVSGCFKPILEWFSEAFGGAVSFKKSNNENARSAWVWQATGDRALHVLETLGPYLREKGIQSAQVVRMRSMGPGPQRDIADGMLRMMKRQSYE